MVADGGECEYLLPAALTCRCRRLLWAAEEGKGKAVIVMFNKEIQFHALYKW